MSAPSKKKKQCFQVEYYDHRLQDWAPVRGLRNFESEDQAKASVVEYRKQFTVDYRFRVKERI